MRLNQSVPSNEVKHKGYLSLQPGTARVLSVVALGCLHLGSVLSFALPKGLSWATLITSGLSLVGMLVAVIMFLCSYSFIANAPEGWIDERELTERNAAYLRALQYVVVMILVGLLVLEVASRFLSHQFTAEEFTKYLNVLFFSSMIMPACLLAWRDQPVVD